MKLRRIFRQSCQVLLICCLSITGKTRRIWSTFREKFVPLVPCLEEVSAVNAVTSSPDDFCDFEINECIWEVDSGAAWSWSRRKIDEITSLGPTEDHRGNNESKLYCIIFIFIYP